MTKTSANAALNAFMRLSFGCCKSHGSTKAGWAGMLNVRLLGPLRLWTNDDSAWPMGIPGGTHPIRFLSTHPKVGEAK